MDFFITLKRRFIARKFRSKDWHIIQHIPFKAFETLINDYVENGWEIESDYHPLKPECSKWQCKLRKGSTVLSCIWRKNAQGEVVGIARVVDSIGAALNIPVYPQPQ